MFNFIKRKIKWVLITIGFLGVAFAGVDLSIQTKTEVTDIINIRQERCLQDTGNYCQFIKGKLNKDLFGTKIKAHDYEVRVDVWEGGKGVLHNQQGYKIRLIDPVIPFVNSTST